MRYTTIEPPASLKNFVRFFWVLESDLSYVHRSMAEVCCEMVFHYKGLFTELKDNTTELSFTSGVQAPSDKIKRFSIDRSFGIFGVYFYPYTIPLLVRTSATEMVNDMIDLKTLLGKEGEELEERVMLASSDTARVELLTSYLEKKLCFDVGKYHNLFTAMRRLIDTKGNIRIAQLAADHAMSERQFERKFKLFSGFNPKLFSRIIRFHAACSQYDKKKKSLTAIALDCGYYDQSHFIHEFKQFSGLHPKSFFSGNAEGTEWRQ
jgi:AraC-like DNA-binding protein